MFWSGRNHLKSSRSVLSAAGAGGRHGNRFRGRRRGFNHFYDGFYYAVPWWEDGYYDDGGDDYGRGRGGGDHEDWCFSRYKSYKPRSNTWTDYDGNTRECVSPFG